MKLPVKIDRVFSFFSDACNLERITPPELCFRVTSAPPIRIAEGAVIDFRLRLFGVPFSWQTRISVWKPPSCFVDEQLHGPFTPIGSVKRTASPALPMKSNTPSPYGPSASSLTRLFTRSFAVFSISARRPHEKCCLQTTKDTKNTKKSLRDLRVLRGAKRCFIFGRLFSKTSAPNARLCDMLRSTQTRRGDRRREIPQRRFIDILSFRRDPWT